MDVPCGIEKPALACHARLPWNPSRSISPVELTISVDASLPLFIVSVLRLDLYRTQSGSG